MTCSICGACCSACSGTTNSKPSRLTIYRHIVITTSAPSARNEPEGSVIQTSLPTVPIINPDKPSASGPEPVAQSSSDRWKPQARHKRPKQYKAVLAGSCTSVSRAPSRLIWLALITIDDPASAYRASPRR